MAPSKKKKSTRPSLFEPFPKLKLSNSLIMNSNHSAFLFDFYILKTSAKKSFDDKLQYFQIL